MPLKQKVTQNKTPKEVQGRDLFQTPNYATELVFPYMPSTNFWWECACGDGKITDVLVKHNLNVVESDLRKGHNFLFDKLPPTLGNNFGIITNPPFSLKEEFYLKCLSYDVPFALLIPFDFTTWMWKAFKNDGCQGIVPERRIDFITPSGKTGASGHTANFHSFWLTRKFNLPAQFIYTELSIADKRNI